MASYADPADLLKRCRPDIISALVTEGGATQSQDDLESDAILLEVLAYASGEIEAALLVGNQYTPTQLESLTGNSLALLRGITCDIALARLFDRNPGINPSLWEAYTEKADKVLERIRRGTNVFNLTAQRDAGLVDVSTPTIAQIQAANRIVSRAYRYYPNQASRLPRT